MKTLVLSFVLCLLFGLNYAQSTYYPLIDTGKTWHVMEGGIGGPTLTFTYKVEGDTIINQDDYKILYRSDEEFPVNWTKHGYIREDEDKKVYYAPDLGFDTLLYEPAMVYDFGAEINDTLLITSYAYNWPTELEIVILAVDSVLIGDNYKRRWLYECEYFTDNFWIEGIGSNNGLIEPGFYCYIVCPYIELLCVKEEGNVIYYNEYYEECYIVGIKENAISKQKFLVYPNPVKSDIHIIPQTNAGSDLVFILYNLKSEVIIQRIIINYNPLIIKTNNLKDGLYLYRIIDNSLLVQNGKIIIIK